MEIKNLEPINASFKIAIEAIIKQENYEEPYTGVIETGTENGYFYAILNIQDEDENVHEQYYLVDWDDAQEAVNNYIEETFDDILRDIPVEFQHCFNADLFFETALDLYTFGENILGEEYPNCEYYDEIDGIVIYKV